MDLRKIEYFIKVAETLNFSAAAAELHISHQALSKQIQMLEATLGARLFERSTTRVSLTEVGRKCMTFLNLFFTQLIRDIRRYKDMLSIKRKR